MCILCVSTKSVTKAITSICAKFLWHGLSGDKKWHNLSWKTICMERDEGGLGIKCFELMNDALVLKQLWDLSNVSSILWNKWVHTYWTKGNQWWQTSNLPTRTWVLKRLNNCIDISRKCTTVSNGALRWIGRGGGFTVKDTYNSLKEDHPKVSWYKLVWNKYNSPKASFNAVLAAHDRLLTKDRMRCIGIVVDPTCVLCNDYEETRDHLFLECKVSRFICQGLGSFLGFHSIPTCWHLLIPWFNSLPQKGLQTKLLAADLTQIMYEV